MLTNIYFNNFFLIATFYPIIHASLVSIQHSIQLISIFLFLLQFLQHKPIKKHINITHYIITSTIHRLSLVIS